MEYLNITRRVLQRWQDVLVSSIEPLSETTWCWPGFCHSAVDTCTVMGTSHELAGAFRDAGLR